jgi:THO complex subunit 1
MAVSAVDSQDAVVARLEYLLQRARVVKPSSAIDPPLQVSELVPEDEALLGDIEGEDDNRKLAVDSATKTLFYANLVSPVLHHPRVLLICPGSDPYRRARVCGYLESARYSAVLRRPRYV